eukprot:ctg_4543.g662
MHLRHRGGVLISAAVSTVGTSQVERATSGGVAHAQTHRTHPQRTFGSAVTGGATGVADAVVRGYRHAEGAEEKKSDIGSGGGRDEEGGKMCRVCGDRGAGTAGRDTGSWDGWKSQGRPADGQYHSFVSGHSFTH